MINSLCQLMQILLLLCFILQASMFATEAGSDKKRDFIKDANAAREVWDLLQKLEQGDKDIQEKVEKQLSAIPKKYAVTRYLAARLSFLKTGKIDSSTISSESSIAMLFEEIVIAIQATVNCPEKEVVYKDFLGELLPISRWRLHVDGRMSEYTAFPKPPRPQVPAAGGENLMIVASLFGEAGMPDLAWRAYAEFVYGEFAPPWPSGHIEESTLSEKASDVWIKVAEWARKANRMELAHDFLFKAAVFGNQATLDEGKKVYGNWLKNTEVLQNKPVDKNKKREALSKILSAYADMSVHPRAFKLLSNHAPLFENAQKLRKEIEEDWVEKVKAASVHANRVVLFGKQVYPTGDPTQIEIPWAFSENAIELVKNKLKTILEK